MDGSDRGATVDEFVSTLQRAVSCVTRAVLIVSRAEPTVPSLVRFSERLVSLQGADRLSISLLHAVEVRKEPADKGAGRVRSLGYWYQIYQRDGSEVIAFHWHPEPPATVPFPHLHVDGRSAAPTFDRRRHVPTGRVSLEAVVRFAIAELDVRPLRDDWQRVLGQGTAAFDAGRTW